MEDKFVVSPMLNSSDLGTAGLGREGEGRAEHDRNVHHGSATNRLCVALVVLLFLGLFMGFVLGMYSIHEQFTGVLECFTIVFTPIGTGCTIVFTRAVKKSELENSSKDGEGIKYALAMRELEE